MRGSTIYVKCPQCAGTTLVVHAGPSYCCAGCRFDYGELAKDRSRFESYLVERMREGPMGQLGAIALHQWLSGLGAGESAQTIRALAEHHGIALPGAIDTKKVILKTALIVALSLGVLLGLLLLLPRLL